jgi:heme/copper-type cytochrome/quinol oxidase subunit 4
MPVAPFGDELAHSRRISLLSFYMAAILSTAALGVVGSDQFLRKLLLCFATGGAATAVWFLLRFLRSNDERERQINYRALTFGFIGTLIFSFAIGFLQSFGFHSISWLGIPAVMVILWSIGLILYSWRYQ